MKQKLITPEILPCAICGSAAKVIDWNYNMQYRVICNNNHTVTGSFITRHRAICKWNNIHKTMLDIIKSDV